MAKRLLQEEELKEIHRRREEMGAYLGDTYHFLCDLIDYMKRDGPWEGTPIMEDYLMSLNLFKWKIESGLEGLKKAESEISKMYQISIAMALTDDKEK